MLTKYDKFLFYKLKMNVKFFLPNFQVFDLAYKEIAHMRE